MPVACVLLALFGASPISTRVDLRSEARSDSEAIGGLQLDGTASATMGGALEHLMLTYSPHLVEEGATGGGSVTTMVHRFSGEAGAVLDRGREVLVTARVETGRDDFSQASALATGSSAFGYVPLAQPVRFFNSHAAARLNESFGHGGRGFLELNGNLVGGLDAPSQAVLPQQRSGGATAGWDATFGADSYTVSGRFQRTFISTGAAYSVSGASAGWTRALSPRISLRTEAGASLAVGSQRSLLPVGTAELSWHPLQGAIGTNATASVSAAPFSDPTTGVLLTRAEARSLLSLPLTRELALLSSLAAARGVSSLAPAKIYASGSMALAWSMNASWTLSGGARAVHDLQDRWGAFVSVAASHADIF